jgi:aminoglycoside 3-N-acetyltransferase
LTLSTAPTALLSSFKEIGIRSSDTVLLHCDANVLAFVQGDDVPRRANRWFEALFDVLGPEGNLIVPTFTYSFTAGEIYDPAKSPSGVGALSEHFRFMPGVKRTLDPIFSFAAHGPAAQQLAVLAPATCFGPGSVFEFLEKQNARLVFAGCSFDRATFVHYVEQKRTVSYRYFKRFAGRVSMENGNLVETSVDYFVRDLHRKTCTNLARLKSRLLADGKMKTAAFERVQLLGVSAQDFLREANALLDENETALIEEGNA